MRLAVALLTIVPVPLPRTPRPLGSAAPWFPLVGALVGAAAGGVFALADALGATPPVTGVLTALTLVALTGALHLDGLADCADAVGVRGGRERRLVVMRESTIGTFGALALGAWLLLASAALADPRLDAGEAIAALVLAAALGRAVAVAHAHVLPPARAEGLGHGFTPAPLVGLLVLPVTAVAAALAAPAALPSLAAGVTAGALVTVGAHRGLGGRTGDTLGATVAVVEVVTLLGLTGALAS